MKNRENVQVAIDGPAGVGKTTVGRKLAENYNWLFVESGMLYRALACSKIHDLGNSSMDLRTSEYRELKVFIDGEDVTDLLESEEVAEAASEVAQNPDIRDRVTDRLRDLVENRSAVVEGRDIGTVVLPGAEVKIFLTADLKTRAHRRGNQLPELQSEDPEKLQNQIQARDDQDRERHHSPLKPAEDAFIVDTTSLGVEETIEKLRGIIDKNIGEAR